MADTTKTNSQVREDAFSRLRDVIDGFGPSSVSRAQLSDIISEFSTISGVSMQVLMERLAERADA